MTSNHFRIQPDFSCMQTINQAPLHPTLIRTCFGNKYLWRKKEKYWRKNAQHVKDTRGKDEWKKGNNPMMFTTDILNGKWSGSTSRKWKKFINLCPISSLEYAPCKDRSLRRTMPCAGMKNKSYKFDQQMKYDILLYAVISQCKGAASVLTYVHAKSVRSSTRHGACRAVQSAERRKCGQSPPIIVCVHTPRAELPRHKPKNRQRENFYRISNLSFVHKLCPGLCLVWSRVRHKAARTYEWRGITTAPPPLISKRRPYFIFEF